MRSRSQGPRLAARQGGVALVEVLISILIFSFGVLGLLALEARAITFSVDSENRTRAAMFANEIGSNMWVTGSVTLNAVTLTALQARVSNQALGGLPSGTLAITPVTGTTNSTDIRITWQSPSHTSDPTSNNLTTRVTLP